MRWINLNSLTTLEWIAERKESAHSHWLNEKITTTNADWYAEYCIFNQLYEIKFLECETLSTMNYCAWNNRDSHSISHRLEINFVVVIVLLRFFFAINYFLCARINMFSWNWNFFFLYLESFFAIHPIEIFSQELQ